jgi:hypothetical protein
MKVPSFARLPGPLILLALSTSCLAQNPPGEDPVILSKRVGVQMLPVGNAKGSAPMTLATDLPASAKAKIARYEAKFNADQAPGKNNEAAATQSATSDGLKKTCIQEVGSNTLPATPGGSRVGPGNQQIVVLRGDLVNICR